jgi:hypothetical protein
MTLIKPGFNSAFPTTGKSHASWLAAKSRSDFALPLGRAAAGGDRYVYSATLRAWWQSTQFCPAKLRPQGFTHIIASGNYVPAKLPPAKSRSDFALPLGARKGLQRKARRICIGKSEDLERKARFFAALAAKNAPEFRILKFRINAKLQMSFWRGLTKKEFTR